MNSKLMERMKQIAQSNGLAFDQKSETIYGVRNGYEICLNQFDQTKNLTLSFSVVRSGQYPTLDEMKRIMAVTLKLKNCRITGSKVSFTLMSGLDKNNAVEVVNEALTTATSFLYNNGYENCCQMCGKAGDTEACVIGGALMLTCEECFMKLSNNTDLKVQAENVKSENILAGAVGALLGTFAGVILIVILGQLGYVAALSGVVMAVCALKGYELLGGKLSTTGIVISVILMVIMVYFGHRLDYAISVASQLKYSIFAAFSDVSYLLQEELLDPGAYYAGLGALYLFAALGAVPTIIQSYKSKKAEKISYRIN